jgi:hypothetical protein
MARPHEFIHRVILRHATTEALQRSGVYARSADAHLRARFNIAARTALRELGDQYSVEVSTPDSWCAEIQTICDALANRFRNHLTSGRVRFGIVQRMVALYLKHRWLLGDENKRPIFPVVDRLVMTLAQVPNPPNWSELDSVSDYLHVVDWIETIAAQKGYPSGVEWEAAEGRQFDDDLDFP